MKAKFSFPCAIMLIVLCSGQTGISQVVDIDRGSPSVEVFAEGTISTNLNERDMAISVDGNELFYTMANINRTVYAIVGMKRKRGRWSKPAIVEFSGLYKDIEPFLSPEGDKLFFLSNRPMDNDTTRTDYNIWYSQRTSEGWGEPKAISSVVNTELNEFYPSVSRNGNLYFTATYDDGPGREDIYMSEFKNGSYQQPKALGSQINSSMSEYNAYISPDEQVLIFSADGREEGLGGGDLFISEKNDDGSWQPARHLGNGINSNRIDFCPFIDFARGKFYFTSKRVGALQRADSKTQKFSTLKAFKKEMKAYKKGSISALDGMLNGLGNIYTVDISELGLKKNE